MENKFEQIKTVVSKCPQIAYCGNIATESLIKTMRKAEEDYINMKISEELNTQDEAKSLSVSEIDDMYRQLCIDSFDIVDKLNELKYLVEDVGQDVKPDISSLKKRIKHCKNHMEKQRLQRELNALYKEQKRRK